jgi:plastocyanin
MKGLRASAVVVGLVALSLAGSVARADDRDDDKVPARATVAFGTGNNNAQPGNTPNHHVLPQEIKVRITSAKKLDGTVVVVPATVNFVVSGFHWVWVYKNGVTLQEVAANISAALFVNYEVLTNGVSNVYAKGIFPGTPPTFADAAAFPLAGGQNRTDTIAFSTPGRFLVICNVAPHLVDGMYAWVRVVAEDDDDDDHGHHH